MPGPMSSYEVEVTLVGGQPKYKAILYKVTIAGRFLEATYYFNTRWAARRWARKQLKDRLRREKYEVEQKTWTYEVHL